MTTSFSIEPKPTTQEDLTPYIAYAPTCSSGLEPAAFDFTGQSYYRTRTRYQGLTEVRVSANDDFGVAVSYFTGRAREIVDEINDVNNAWDTSPEIMTVPELHSAAVYAQALGELELSGFFAGLRLQLIDDIRLYNCELDMPGNAQVVMDLHRVWGILTNRRDEFPQEDGTNVNYWGNAQGQLPIYFFSDLDRAIKCFEQTMVMRAEVSSEPLPEWIQNDIERLKEKIREIFTSFSGSYTFVIEERNRCVASNSLSTKRDYQKETPRQERAAQEIMEWAGMTGWFAPSLNLDCCEIQVLDEGCVHRMD